MDTYLAGVLHARSSVLERVGLSCSWPFASPYPPSRSCSSGAPDYPRGRATSAASTSSARDSPRSRTRPLALLVHHVLRCMSAPIIIHSVRGEPCSARGGPRTSRSRGRPGLPWGGHDIVAARARARRARARPAGAGALEKCERELPSLRARKLSLAASVWKHVGKDAGEG
jgi:hypothetical protein